MNTYYRYLATILVSFLCIHSASAQRTFEVTSTDDLADFIPGNGFCETAIGTCSLRAAIQEANLFPNGAEPDRILFTNIPMSGGQAIIDVVGFDLPYITDAVIINGETAPGEVIINGTQDARYGLKIEESASGSVIKGLTVGNFIDSGIYVDLASDVVIKNNYVGVSWDGTDYGNRIRGIFASGDRNKIGGVGAGNVVGFNILIGINIGTGVDSKVQGNFIGTTPSYQEAPNFTGLLLGLYSEVTVGGYHRDLANVIGFNLISGLTAYSVENTVIRNNYIGTNELGEDLGNDGYGIHLQGQNIKVGGSKSYGNVIGFNDTGIGIINYGNKIKGNYIGATEADEDIGNLVGIYIEVEEYDDEEDDAAQFNQIGYARDVSIPMDQENANTIAYNEEAGIVVDYHPDFPGITSYNSIRGNHIYDNGEIGIDLIGTTGPDLNDVDDADVGGNDLLNYPDVVRVDYNGSFDAIGIEYSISSDPAIVNYPLTVDVYIADDPVSGEGKTYIGSDTYETLRCYPASGF